MKEFVLATLPCVIIGLCIVVICANKKVKRTIILVKVCV